MILEKSPVSVHLDVQRGTVRTETEEAVPVTSQDMLFLYWLALEAPEERIARALKMDDGDTVATRITALREKLGLGNSVPRLSLSNGPAPASAWPWPERTAVTIIRKGLARSSRDPLIYVADEGALTADEVSDLVRRVGAGLQKEGIAKGGRVAVDSTQRLESYLIALATLLIGGVVVFLNEAIGPATLCNMVRRAPAMITFSDRFAEIGPLCETGARVSLSSCEGVREFSDWMDGCPEQGVNIASTVSVTPSDPAVITFSSGSTGEPKAIILSHERIFRTTETANKLLRFTPDDIFCTAMELGTMGGFRSVVTHPFWCGGRSVIPTEEARRQPLALALDCETYGVTRLTAVPNVLRGFVKARDRLGEDCLSTLRLVLCGTGILDHATAKSFGDLFGVAVVDNYASRETGAIIYADPDLLGTLGSTGGRAAEVLIRIVNDDGTASEPGEVGEISVHTDSLPLGYLGPVDTSVTESEGWYWTRDLARVNEDGRIEIVGRRRDIVKTQEGGLVSPAEIENVLYSMEIVREACVFGWTCGDGVERLGAFVIPTEALNDHAQAASEIMLKSVVLEQLGSYKVPAHILFCDEFPRVGLGKPDKQKMRLEFQSIYS